MIEQRSLPHVLVTGAAGFIGSHLSQALIRSGYRVSGFDNFDPSYDPAIKRRNISGLTSEPGFTLIEGDIRSARAVAAAFRRGPFVAVVHLAALAGVRASIGDPSAYEDINVGGTIKLLERACTQPGVHFIYGSSSSVYGSDCRVPFQEKVAADRPSSPYAATKRAAELMAHSFHQVHGTQVTSLRFFTVYGPRQRPEMAIHKFTRLIDSGQEVEMYGDGTSRRDYTYIDDIVDGVEQAIQRPAGFRIFNLGTTSTTSLNDLIGMIATRLGKVARVKRLSDQPGDVPITWADISSARAELGYNPHTSLSVGLDRFIQWYSENGVATPPDHPEDGNAFARG